MMYEFFVFPKERNGVWKWLLKEDYNHRQNSILKLQSVCNKNSKFHFGMLRLDALLSFYASNLNLLLLQFLLLSTQVLSATAARRRICFSELFSGSATAIRFAIRSSMLTPIGISGVHFKSFSPAPGESAVNVSLTHGTVVVTDCVNLTVLPSWHLPWFIQPSWIALAKLSRPMKNREKWRHQLLMMPRKRLSSLDAEMTKQLWEYHVTLIDVVNDLMILEVWSNFLENVFGSVLSLFL